MSNKPKRRRAEGRVEDLAESLLAEGGEIAESREAGPAVSSPMKRRRGAQPGNLNALKHGFYTRKLKTAVGGDLVAAEFLGLDEEISMLRAHIRRVYAMGEEARSFSESRALLRVLCLASGSLNRLLLTQHWLTATRDEFMSIGRDEFLEILLQTMDQIDEEIGQLDPRLVAEEEKEWPPDPSSHPMLGN